MAAVGGGVNKHVFRPGFHAALDGGLQVLVVAVGFLKGQVIKEDDEALAGVLAQACHDFWQVAELGFLHLDEAQAVGVVGLGQCLDAGGLACASGAYQQHVVGRAAADKCQGVADELLLLPLVGDNIFKVHCLKVADARQLLMLGVPAEGRIGGNLAIAVFGIVGQECLGDFLRGGFAGELLFQVFGGFQLLRQGWDVAVQQLYVDNVHGSLGEGRQQLFHIVNEGILQAGADVAAGSLCHLCRQAALLAEQVQEQGTDQVAAPAFLLRLFHQVTGKAVAGG